jgi:transcriptional regulator of met regulon
MGDYQGWDIPFWEQGCDCTNLKSIVKSIPTPASVEKVVTCFRLMLLPNNRGANNKDLVLNTFCNKQVGAPPVPSAVFRGSIKF